MIRLSFSNTRNIDITECEWKDIQIAIRDGHYSYGCFDGAEQVVSAAEGEKEMGIAETKTYPVAWMVVRDSCDPAEFFITETDARKNACLGLANTHVVPLYGSAATPLPTAGKLSTLLKRAYDDWQDDSSDPKLLAWDYQAEVLLSMLTGEGKYRKEK